MAKKKTFSLYGIEIEEPEVRERRGFHSLTFDDRVVPMGGQQVKLMSEGFDAVAQFHGTRSPQLLTGRIVALHLGLIQGKLKLLTQKEYQELQEKAKKYEELTKTEKTEQKEKTKE